MSCSRLVVPTDQWPLATTFQLTLPHRRGQGGLSAWETGWFSDQGVPTALPGWVLQATRSSLCSRLSRAFCNHNAGLILYPIKFQLSAASVVQTDLLILTLFFKKKKKRLFACDYQCGCWPPFLESFSWSRHHCHTWQTRAEGPCGAYASVIVQAGNFSLSFLCSSFRHSGGMQRSAWLLEISSHGNAHQWDRQRWYWLSFGSSELDSPPHF